MSFRHLAVQEPIYVRRDPSCRISCAPAIARRGHEGTSQDSRRLAPCVVLGFICGVTTMTATRRGPFALEPPLEHHLRGPRLRIGVVAPPFLPVPPIGYGGIERSGVGARRGLGASRSRRDAVRHGRVDDERPAREPAHHDRPARRSCRSRPTSSITRPRPTSRPMSSTSSTTTPGRDRRSARCSAGARPSSTRCTARGPNSSRRLFELLADRVDLVAISHAQRAANPQHPLRGRRLQWHRPRASTRFSRQGGLRGLCRSDQPGKAPRGRGRRRPKERSFPS